VALLGQVPLSYRVHDLRAVTCVCPTPTTSACGSRMPAAWDLDHRAGVFPSIKVAAGCGDRV